MARPLSPRERALRSLNGRIGAHESWARTEDREARTAPARAASMARFEREVDPDGALPARERAVRAEHAMKAHMARMARARWEKAGSEVETPTSAPDVLSVDVGISAAGPTVVGTASGPRAENGGELVVDPAAEPTRRAS